MSPQRRLRTCQVQSFLVEFSLGSIIRMNSMRFESIEQHSKPLLRAHLAAGLPPALLRTSGCKTEGLCCTSHFSPFLALLIFRSQYICQVVRNRSNVRLEPSRDLTRSDAPDSEAG